MRYSTALIPVAFLVTNVFAVAPPDIPGMKLAFHDDFAGVNNKLDTTKWNYYTGATSNGEMEKYTNGPENCVVSGNSFSLVPTYVGTTWESCRVETSGSWQAPSNGKIRFQGVLNFGPQGGNGGTHKGMWPAFWTLGQDMRETGAKNKPWPQCGEIDTFEMVNGNSQVHGTLHCGPACNDNPDDGLGAATGFDPTKDNTFAHVIDLTNGDYKQQSITWFLNEKSYHTITGAGFDQKTWSTLTQQAYYITLNVAVGGGWPGSPGPSTANGTASAMEVKYIAVYTSS